MAKNIRGAVAGLALTTAMMVAGAAPAVAEPAEEQATGSWSGSAAPFERFPALDWANDPECVPAPEHPRPVLLVHGTWGDASVMESIGRELGEQGHCVHAVNYGRHDESVAGAIPGIYGVADLESSGEEIHRAIRDVAATTAGQDAGEIDVVGHSQGAAVLKLAMNDHGDAEVVHTAVYVAGTHRGTTSDGLQDLGVHDNPGSLAISDAVLGPASVQQIVGSEQVAHLRSLPDTQPGVHYVVLVSDDDTTAAPPRDGFIEAGPGATVVNAAVQDVCADAPDPLSHVDIRDHTVGADLVADALAGRELACD
ncbi:triacylglycerol lipase [uncultured Corynebacterium sp.]|uniref:esterase/lipase family protein n=1 Tax=uncultured Corynebacterium sp. TaxID=159447 RepID=UPI0025D29169|nr:alpha/beta fold hydrolase [uncultured Corynebacterium sp.]